MVATPPPEPKSIADGEPPLIERARRIGWALLLLAALLAVWWRSGGGATWVGALALGCALIGGLAIVNVLLVRSLYRQIAAAPAPEKSEPEP